MTDEDYAREIVQIMKDANTGAGEIMMRGTIDHRFLERRDNGGEALMNGYRYAESAGWIEWQSAFVQLTALGESI